MLKLLHSSQLCTSSLPCPHSWCKLLYFQRVTVPVNALVEHVILEQKFFTLQDLWHPTKANYFSVLCSKSIVLKKVKCPAENISKK